MSDTFVSKGSSRERIDPSTEDVQRLLVDAIGKLISNHSENWGTVNLVIPTGTTIVGPNQFCKEVWVSFDSTNSVYISINTEDRDATAVDLKIPEDNVLKIPVANVNQIHFKGSAADIIHLMWRD